VEMRDFAKSLWSSVAAPMAHQTDELNENVRADVVIIGAGFCGLSAAIHLAKNGVDVVCLEAEHVGWGASGRNNGQVIPGLKRDPDDVFALLGAEAGEKLLRCSAQAPELVFSLVDELGIQCDAVNRGWIQPARSTKALQDIAARVEQWQRFGEPVEMLNERDLAQRLGTDWYRGAWLDKRGGSLNPLAYARGLADAAIRLGVRLYEGTKVTSYEPVAGTSTSKSTNVGVTQWRVNVANDPSNNGATNTSQETVYNRQVNASTLLLCTNAYGNVNQALRRSIVPVRTGQIATAPLPDPQWQQILPRGEAASDASRILTSFRLSADKRLVMGGAFATGGGESEQMFARLVNAAQARFPFLGEVNVEFAWSGYLAITKSHLPHIFSLAPNCFAPVGCNGRGIAMSTATGKALAELLLHEKPEDCLLPVSQADPFVFHDFRNLGISASVAWNGLLDTLDTLD